MITDDYSEDVIYEYSVSPTLMRLNNHYYTIYCIWLNFIFNGIGPFVLLITLNTLMLIRLKQMTEENDSVMTVNIKKFGCIILSRGLSHDRFRILFIFFLKCGFTIWLLLLTSLFYTSLYSFSLKMRQLVKIMNSPIDNYRVCLMVLISLILSHTKHVYVMDDLILHICSLH